MNQKEKGVEVHDTPGQWFRTPVVHPMKRNSQEVRESQKPKWHGNPTLDKRSGQSILPESTSTMKMQFEILLLLLSDSSPRSLQRAR